jgi:hypothetical protein
MAVLGYTPYDGHLWSEYLTTGPGVVVYIFITLSIGEVHTAPFT